MDAEEQPKKVWEVWEALVGVCELHLFRGGEDTFALLFEEVVGWGCIGYGDGVECSARVIEVHSCQIVSINYY